MNEDKAKSLLSSSVGKFVSVDFVKNDGTPRTVTGKLAPLSPSMAAKKDVYLNIQLSEKDPFGVTQYRNVKASTVQRIRMEGKEYE